MITERLSQFLAPHRPDAAPRPEAAHDRSGQGAKGALVNFFAPAPGGCRNEGVEILVATLAECFGPPQATVIGRSERTDALTATFLNAVSSNVLDFDDTH